MPMPVTVPQVRSGGGGVPPAPAAARRGHLGQRQVLVADLGARLGGGARPPGCGAPLDAKAKARRAFRLARHGYQHAWEHRCERASGLQWRRVSNPRVCVQVVSESHGLPPSSMAEKCAASPTGPSPTQHGKRMSLIARRAQILNYSPQ